MQCYAVLETVLLRGKIIRHNHISPNVLLSSNPKIFISNNNGEVKMNTNTLLSTDLICLTPLHEKSY